MIEEFNKYYPNVKVEYEVYKNNGDGNVAADTSIMAGNVDVILSFGVSNTSDRWSNGMLMDITDRLAEDNLDLVKEWGTDTYKYEDRVYAFPSGGLSIYVAINKDKWDAAGLGEVPSAWTWDEYLDACRKMTEKGADGKTVVYGGSDFNQTDYWTYSIRQSKGMNAFYTADGNADFDNPLFAKILQREIDAENEGIWYSKANYLADSTKSRDMFLNGTNASTVESILTRYIVAGDPQFKITYAPYPVNEKGETNYMAAPSPTPSCALPPTPRTPTLPMPSPSSWLPTAVSICTLPVTPPPGPAWTPPTSSPLCSAAWTRPRSTSMWTPSVSMWSPPVNPPTPRTTSPLSPTSSLW